MSLALRIIAEFNDISYENSTSFNRDQASHLTIKLLANFLDEFPYQPDKFRCWCKAKKDDSYINIINDELLQTLLTTYWRDHSEFEVIFFDNQALSPNSTLIQADESTASTSINLGAASASALESLTSKLSLQEPDNNIDPFSQEEVTKIPPINRLKISNNKHTIIVDSDYIIDFIEFKLNRGHSIFEIDIDFTANNKDESIRFTSDVWSRCLLRNHKNAKLLLQKFTQFCERSLSYSSVIKSFHENQAELVMKIKIFLSDLMSFNNDPDAKDRLERGDHFHMSDIYFTDNEHAMILNFPTANGLKFSELLSFKMKEKAKEGNTEICAAHDIAPIFMKVFLIQKGFSEAKVFKEEKKKFEKSYRKNKK